MERLLENSEQLPPSRKNAASNFPLLVLVIACLHPAAQAQGAGFWHTQGSQIVDSNGRTVRIAGINWFGFETQDEVVHGLWNQDYRRILHDLRVKGYNTLRLPFSNQMVESPIIPIGSSGSGEPGTLNGDLAGLNSLQIMDKIIDAAGAEGLRVILDNHRSEAGDGNEANGLWYTDAYPESRWIADWEFLTRRYSRVRNPNGDPVVIGVDLRNEPYSLVGTGSAGACWTGDAANIGCPATDKAHNWPSAAERAAAAILNLNPNLLIFVEGVDCYNGDCTWQGGNLEGARRHPVQLPIDERLVYSAHDYGPHLYRQPWFNRHTTPASLEAVWARSWAYLSLTGTAPVWLSSFATSNQPADIESRVPGSQGQWFSSLTSFLRQQPQIGWCYWAVNSEVDSGLLGDNYAATPASALKQAVLASIQFPLAAVEISAPPDNAEPMVRVESPQVHRTGIIAGAAAAMAALILVFGKPRSQRRPRLKKNYRPLIAPMPPKVTYRRNSPKVGIFARSCSACGAKVQLT